MRKFKGFTLIECLVALAILGVASLIMAQIYANVSRINRSNHLVNTSLSYQMALVEKQTKTDAIPLYFGRTTDADPELSSNLRPPHVYTTDSDLDKPQIKITSSYKDVNIKEQSVYSYPVDIYVLESRDQNNKPSSDADYSGEDEKNYRLRYKYILGH